MISSSREPFPPLVLAGKAEVWCIAGLVDLVPEPPVLGIVPVAKDRMRRGQVKIRFSREEGSVIGVDQLRQDRRSGSPGSHDERASIGKCAARLQLFLEQILRRL